MLALWSAQLLYAQEKTVTRIAFGSCSDEDKEQIWKEVIVEKPDLWIWLGDNIYADTYDRRVMKKKYDKQKSHPDYQKLKALCPIIGTWDDHDYGLNDGGKEYPMKKESKELLLDFLDVPANADVRKHEGMYSSYTYGEGSRKVKVILLDTRYFRDPLKESSNKNERYTPTDKGDMLGEAQWEWLTRELEHSDASLHIIGTSIQFIPTLQGYEKWGNLSTSRNRMLALLAKLKPKNTFFISGDRHIAEISKMTVEGLPYPLYDFTSSGLTHTWESGWEENPFRVGDMIKQKNFGMILVDWSKATPLVTLQVHGYGGKIYLEHAVQY
jgi:alkaline phosphatase D